MNGEQDFINLLNEARIDAERVINPNIKMKVMGIRKTGGDTLAQSKLGSEVVQKQADLVESVPEDNTINTVSSVPPTKNFVEVTDLNKTILNPKGSKRKLEIIEPRNNSLKRFKINGWDYAEN